MKLFSILALCAALCIAITQASSQMQKEENSVSLGELLGMIANQAEAEGFDNTDEEEAAVIEDLIASRILSRRQQAEAEKCECHCPSWKKKSSAKKDTSKKNIVKQFTSNAISATEMLQKRKKAKIQCNCCSSW